MIVWLAVMLQMVPLEVVAVRSEPVGEQHKLSVEANRDWGPVPVRRDGSVVTASFPAVLAKGLIVPPPAPPLEAIELKSAGDTVQLRVTVAPEVGFEVQRRGRELTLVFGAPAEATIPEGISPDLLALYHSLRPPSASQPDPLGDPAAPEPEEDLPGVGFGPFRFQPMLLVGYARSQTSIDEPTPVEDSYFQLEPRLGTQLSLFDGRIRGNYEPQLRGRSKFEKINRPSHEANLRADIPIGTRFVVHASEHYTTSTLDAQEVDPGREYFFGLGRFWRSDTWGGLRMEVGPRLRLIGRAGLNRVRFEEASSFFDYDQRRAEGGAEIDLSEGLTAILTYTHEHVPPPATRPIVESTARSGMFGLRAQLALIQLDVSAGYRRHEAPLAGEGGRSYEGLTASARLIKPFGRGTRLTLTGGRGLNLSGFAENAFYVTDNVQATVDAQLPLGLSVRFGGGYHWNAYPTVETAIGEKRRDRLYGWTAGVSRPLTRWSYLRVDYAWDRRESNIPGLDNESSLLLAQLGVGLFGSSEQ